MELISVRCLINSISRFIHLATCCAPKMPTQKDFKDIANCLKNLKPLLDSVVDNKIPSDESVCQRCEELDIAINEAREFLERWSLKMSKILCVLLSKQLVVNIQSSSLKISRKLLELSSSTLSLPDAQHRMQEFQNLKMDKISDHIEEALESQRQGKIPQVEHLRAIIEAFVLTSKHELLNECIALEKERIKAEKNNLTGDLDRIGHIIYLVSHIRDHMAKLESFTTVNGTQIPSYFRCPLSLELMVEPVIVASGQTFERAAIQKWLDNGLHVCPKTHQELSHTNLIPNYTVKTLIQHWCEENKIMLPETSGCPTSFSVVSQSADSFHVDSFPCSMRSKNASPRSSREVSHNSEKLKNGSSRFDDKVPESGISQFTQSSAERSCSHSRSGSASSSISSIDCVPAVSTEVSGVSSKHDNDSDFSGDITSNSRTSSFTKHPEYSPLSAKPYSSSKTLGERAVNGKYSFSRNHSFQSETGSSDTATAFHVEQLVEGLKSGSTELQTSAAAELRFLAKNNTENRVIIGHCGAIAPLISLLHSDIQITQEHAATALLNLSINDSIKAMIADEGVVEPLIYVLRTGNAGAKENAAAAVFSISMLEEYRIKIGRSGAVKALVELLGSGTLRGKKDAATALFNLSIFHENKARIVQAGAVKHLVELLDPAKEMVDKAVALLANLSTVSEGCTAIARAGGIPALVEILESGSQRGKENAASTILQLCVNSPKYCRLILQEGAVPPLVALSQSGTPRAKEKAQQLLSHFRNQRESAAARGKS